MHRFVPSAKWVTFGAVGRKRWISGLILTGVAIAPPVVAVAVDAPAASSNDPARDIDILQATINSPTANTGDREEAARRLIARDTPETRDLVKKNLSDAGNTPGQIAIATALSQTAEPDPSLIGVLGSLLGNNPGLTKAAALALVNYHDTNQPFIELQNFVKNAVHPNIVRIEAIHAMGSLLDKSVAEYLISLLQDQRENAALQTAAAQALGEMTGLDNGPTPAPWLQWWHNQAGLNDDSFRSQILERRLRRANQMQLQAAQLTEEAPQLLTNTYNRLTDENDKLTTLMSYLNAKSAEIRNLGVALVGFDFSDKRQVSEKPQVKHRIREMVSDSDDTVRLHAIELLLTTNDTSAAGAMVAQLSVEKNPEIKVQLILALAQFEDMDAVPMLVKLLDDPQPGVVTAAAKAFGGHIGGQLQHDNPTLANTVSKKLRQIAAANANQAGANDLRAACMSALAALRDHDSFDTFDHALNVPGETTAVRLAAIDGLGNLADPHADQSLATELDDNDRIIRYEAALALRSVAPVSLAERLRQHVGTETDPETREALWQDFKGLFKQESAEDLRAYATDFADDPEKHLDILIALGDVLQQNKNDQAVATNNQDIAAAMMKLQTPRPLDAIPRLQKAIDYWRGPGQAKTEGAVSLDQLMDDMLQAQLKGGKYKDAVDFAAAQIKIDPANNPSVIPPLRNEADRLIKAGNTAAAQELITAALGIQNLDDKYVPQFKELQQQINDLTAPGQH